MRQKLLCQIKKKYHQLLMNTDFLKSKQFIIIISVIWGFGLACMFSQALSNRTVVVKALHPKKVIGNVFRGPDGKKCYTYIPESSICNKNPIF